MIKIVKDDIDFLLQKVRGLNNKNPKRLLHTELFLKHSAGFVNLWEPSLCKLLPERIK
jgi:hypothetical protein